MKQHFLAAGLTATLLLSLSGCGGSTPAPAPTKQEEGKLRILATTYPIYLFASAITDGVEGVEVTQLITGDLSCLHDYTLTVNDMKAIEAADIIVMNGAGLEDFMDDALATSSAAVIDCSEGVEVLPSQGYEDHEDHDEEEDQVHDHTGEYDPHFWLDPTRAMGMMEHISQKLAEMDAGNAQLYSVNLKDITTSYPLDQVEQFVHAAVGTSSLSDLCSSTKLITFHDGLQYFADAFGLDLLKSIQEEEGAEASAADIREIVALIREHNIPAIFVEKNGSDSTANAIARETGVAVYTLDLLMSGDEAGLDHYSSAMYRNLQTIAEALQ